MKLNQKSTPIRPAQILYGGGQSGILATAGQAFKIETSPDGEDILDVQIPAGKKWLINIQVNAVETDV